jgi:pimeloyl-ACP methyl ester carboxylesterase
MIELERRRLLEEGKAPTEVTAAVKLFVEFYRLYLIEGMTPGEVIAKHPEWKSLWYDLPDGQYGRPAAFYQQLEALNLGEVWQKVTAPVLVLRGSGDNIMSRGDAEAIARNVNQTHPGQAKYVQYDDVTHGLTVNGKFYDEIVPTVLNWMKEQLTAK